MEKNTEKLKLHNKQGECCTITLRKYKRGDEAAMIACIWDEYGASYFKRHFYEPEYLRQKAEDGSIQFLIAENENREIIGMMILKEFYPEEEMCEIASQIFMKQYRGYGLAMPFFQYGMQLLEAKDYSAAYCLPVLFHDVTQRLLYRLGLRATGFILNVFDMDKIRHSYPKGRNRKHSQGIQIKAEGKRYTDLLYLPMEHLEFCEEIYRNLGVSCEIATPGYAQAEHPQNEKCVIKYQNDAEQNSLTIEVYHTGKNLGKRMEKLLEEYPLTGKQTANVFLNINDIYAVEAYEVLKEKGFFFTGLKPLCGEIEWMVLHHAGEVEIYFEDYVLSQEFTGIIKTISQCYRERKTG